MALSGIMVLSAILLLAALCVGIVRWRRPGGKALAILAGLLLLLLAAFVLVVLFLGGSATRDAAM